MKVILDYMEKAHKLYLYYNDCSQAVKLIHDFIGKLDKLLTRLDGGEREEIKNEADKLFKEFNNFKQKISGHFNHPIKNAYYSDFHIFLDQTIEIFNERIKSPAELDKQLCDDLTELIYLFKQNKQDIHPLPHRLRNVIKLPGKWKAILIVFVIALIAAASIFYDKFVMVPSMEKNCQIPLFRSFSWLNRENNKIAGVCYINNYSPSSENQENKQLLNKAEKIFEDLQKIEPYSLQATFFLDYIQELRGSDSQYSRAITMFDEYERYPNNYDLKKEDYDIGIKLGHILTGQQNYINARRFYNFILKKPGNRSHTNALLGICTTHFQMEKSDELQSILNNCKQAIKSLEQEKIEGKDLKNETLATAYYNQGCVQMREGKYGDALASFESGETLNGKNKYLNSAVIFSNILMGNYDKAIEFANGKYFISDTKSGDYNRDNFVSLGFANLALASDSEISSDRRLRYYSNAYENFDRGKLKQSPDSYLKKYLEKAEKCKIKEHINNKYCMQEWSPAKDSKLKKYIHSRFLAFVTQYQMNPIIAKAPFKFIKDGELEGEKGKACTLIKKHK